MQTLLFNKNVIGPYEVGDVLGVGGMGTVYRAYQPLLSRFIALKLFMRTGEKDIGLDQRFIQEVSIAASLEHPHIVPVYDYGSTEAVRYVAMRLLSGGSLTDRLRERRVQQCPFTPEEVRTFLLPIASAVDYAHHKGVVHRDIKPSNILFDEHECPYLVDFGIARLVDTTSNLTNSGAMLGTPIYMPPEQWMGKPVSPATDIYALGVLAYEMLALRPPFDAETPYALMKMHLQDEPPLLHELMPGMPPAIGLCIAQAILKHEYARYPSAAAFAAAFSQAVEGKVIPPLVPAERYINPPGNVTQPLQYEGETVLPPDTELRRSRRPILWMVPLILLTILCGTGAWVTLQFNNRPVVGAEFTSASSTPSPTLAASATFQATSTAMQAVIASATHTISPSVTTSSTPTVTATVSPTASSTRPSFIDSRQSGIKFTSTPFILATNTVAPSPTLTPVTATRVQPTLPPPTRVSTTATAVPPTAVPPARIPPTVVPPTQVLPTAVPPTAVPPPPPQPTAVPPPANPPADNGNNGNGGGNGNGNSGNGNNSNGNGNSGSSNTTTESSSGSSGNSGNGNGGGNRNGNGGGG
jgi:serine/threonine-protein kinase